MADDPQLNNYLGDFDDKFQKAIVGHMMRDRGFRMMVFSNDVQYEHFRDPYIGRAVEAIKKESTTEAGSGVYGPEHLYQMIQKEYSDFKEQNKAKAAIYDCNDAAEELNIEVVTQKMTGWIKLLCAKQMIIKVADLINKKDFNSALAFSEEMNRKINGIDFSPENKTTVKFENTVDFLTRQDENKFKNNCTMGSPVFDELLLEGAAFGQGTKEVKSELMKARAAEIDATFARQREAAKYRGVKPEVYNTIIAPPMLYLTRGSLMPGDATILLGPANAGKTTIIVTMVASNLLMGRDVLLIVHEQHSDDIKMKILQSMIFMSSADLSELAKARPDVIRDYERIINRHLTYVHYIRAGHMHVEAVGGIIEQKQDKWKATHGGKGYDLMVNDYPGKLSARSLTHRNSMKKHEEIAFVYDYLINLGREHKFHSFLAMQTNREGYKVAQGSSSDSRVVDMGDAGESFNPMQLADNVITINRGDEDKLNSRIRLYIGKSRKSQTGHMFVSQTSMARSRAYGEGFFVDKKWNDTTKSFDDVRHSLKCFTAESKVDRATFGELCARYGLGTQIDLKAASDKEMQKATIKAAEPNAKETNMLQGLLEPVPVQKPVV